ncbi:hypothetical protein OG417_51080 [Actinoallomurus sp. NBC_01490]|uniref:hypothetical protein n=1 Tax=Actinoallomurus sp. NBC_01490 TaxID=2903557 RepID=UPI002E3363E8|nr:hypothetical protein [Actinoallomurus sp. NBC_01490]
MQLVESFSDQPAVLGNAMSPVHVIEVLVAVEEHQLGGIAADRLNGEVAGCLTGRYIKAVAEQTGSAEIRGALG